MELQVASLHQLSMTHLAHLSRAWLQALVGAMENKPCPSLAQDTAQH